MTGIVLTSGRVWVLNQMKTKIVGSYGGGLYVGLMTNSLTPGSDDQIDDGITELPSGDCSGYWRVSSNGWCVVSGSAPYISGAAVSFTVMSGIWSDVNGYFVSPSRYGHDAFWVETFPVEKRGDKINGDIITVSPRYNQR